jgi:glycogen operon protein
VTWLEEEQAVNFALYSKHATGVTLLLFAADDVVTPASQYHFNYLTNKSGRIWHCRVPASQVRSMAYCAYQGKRRGQEPFALSARRVVQTNGS